MINIGSKTLKEISAVIKVALFNDTCVGRLVIFFSLNPPICSLLFTLFWVVGVGWALSILLIAG